MFLLFQDAVQFGVEAFKDFLKLFFLAEDLVFVVLEHVISGTVVVAELGLTQAARVGAAGSVARGAVLVGRRRVTHLI